MEKGALMSRRFLVAASLVVISIVAALVAGSLYSRRTGLFNNLPDERRALAEHRQAWRERFPRDPTFEQLTALVSAEGGECADLESSPAYGARGRGKLSCQVVVPGRFPMQVTTNHTWTLIMSSQDGTYSVSEIYRRPFSL